MQATRASLIERLKEEGDQDAWRTFRDLYTPLVLRCGARMGLDPQAREELVSDFLCRMLEALPSFEYTPEKGRFRAYVRQVCLHLVAQRARKRDARRRARDGWVADRREVLEGGRDELEEWWQAEEERVLLELGIERLRESLAPEKFAVFQLVVREGSDPREVAGMYRLKPGAVAVIKCRALKQLRAIVAELREGLE